VKLFLGVVMAHFAEHLAQIFQLYILSWSRQNCLGILGLWQPALMRSEWLHYLYALSMLIGLYYLRPQFNQIWSQRTINLQHYHHLEHLILLTQAIFGFKTTGIGGIWFPRIELHFFYNAVVMIAMLISLDNRHGVSG
jgi:hypothetical protein